ncbi:MAG: hypothetical protein KGH98_03545 [Candidatus Micrarchaeota archaeon]|nr:hypothetical protein [Candidatus Micrarchaeota archaeon]
MERMVTISVKIPRRVKIGMGRLHIKPSKLRALLEREILEEEARKLNSDIDKHKKIFDKISVEDVVEDIREDRAR